MPQTSKPPLHLRVVSNDICIDDQCQNIQNQLKTSWVMVSVRVVNGKMTVFEGDTELSFNGLDDVAVDNLYIGSEEIAPITDVFHLYFVRYYRDALTQREIGLLKTGMPNLIIDFFECQCPHDYIDLAKTDSNICTDGVENLPRFNTTIIYNEPSVTVDGDSNTKWASSQRGSVELTLDFGMSFQISSVEISFDSSVMPERVSCQFISGGSEQTQNFSCSSQRKCSFSMGTLNPTSTEADFRAQLAEQIRIVLHRRQNTEGSFIISDITVNGSCDCNGNAERCTISLASKTYTCSCESETNTQGQSCRSCSPNKFRNTGEFDCQNTCQCNRPGAKDALNQCNELGGSCICKTNVQGERCDTCKPFTFNLTETNSEGCSLCDCEQNGTFSCSNTTGECYCKANVEPRRCDKCKDNNYGFNSPEGCQPCNCETAGTINQVQVCNQITGQCSCKGNVEGRRCDSCKDGFYALETAKPQGCEACGCNEVGIEHGTCNKETGQCPCRGGDDRNRICSPNIVTVDPIYGPQIGGTLVTVRGSLLGNETHKLTVYLGSISQDLISIADDEVVFRTKELNPPPRAATEVKLSWQETSQPLNARSTFSYRANPVIDTSRRTDISTYVSGGCRVFIYGSNLQNVAYPRLEVIDVTSPDIKASAVCKHVVGNIICPSPNLTGMYSSSTDAFQMTAVLDGIIDPDFAKIKVYPDPQFESVDNIRFQYPFEDSITLKGKGLSSACGTSEIAVLIGVVSCTITHLSDTTIECEPPSSPPGSGMRFDIRVEVGNIRETVGTLQYLELHETTGFIIIISCIAAAILITAGVIIICCCCRFRRLHKSPCPPKSMDNIVADPVDERPMNNYDKLTTTPVDTVDTAYTAPAPSNGHVDPVIVETVFREPKKGIPPTTFGTPVNNNPVKPVAADDDFLSKIEPGLREQVEQCYVGSGQFAAGRVCIIKGQRAQMTDGSLQKGGTSGQKLIIKSLLKPVNESELPWWAHLALQECLRLRRFNHTHVHSIAGIGISQQRFHILYPHMSQGILKTVISDIDKDFSARQLLSFGQQVAEAIDFLVSKDITHKDVAARNCMLDEYSVVKLSDAAFSWDFYQNEYVYDDKRERYLPVRWMAPESLTDGYYDMRTDVWSFAVLVWELLTRGCLPFHEVTSSDQVSDYIIEGYILGKPDTLTDELYEILRSCWAPENEMRPSIASVSRSLSDILDGDDDGTYANADEVASYMAQNASGMAATPRKHSSGTGNIYSSAHLSRV